MEIRQLEYFVASAEEKSFFKASKKLYVSQPAISKAINSLEKDIKSALFIRSNKGLQLTPKGEKLYHYAQNILRQIEMIKCDSSSSNKYLKLSSYPSHMLSSALADFYNTQTDDFELDYREGTVQEIINNVKNGISEIGILYISPTQSDVFMHILSHNNLEFVPMKESELCIYVGAAHKRYNTHAYVSIDEINQYKYIRGLHDFFSVEHHFDYVNLNELNTAHFNDSVITNSDHLVSELLEKTDLCYLGISTKVKHIKSKTFIDTDTKKLTFGYIKNKLCYISQTTKDFLDLLEDRYNQ